MFSVLPNRRGRGEQIDLSPVVQQVTDQLSFIDIIKAFSPDFLKAFDTHWQFLSIHIATPLSLPLLPFQIPLLFYLKTPLIASRCLKDNGKNDTRI